MNAAIELLTETALQIEKLADHAEPAMIPKLKALADLTREKTAKLAAGE